MYYITTDIETTGLDIYKDVPIQMAYAIYDEKDQQLQEKSFYICTNRKLLPIITRITGITDDTLYEKGISPRAGVVHWQSILKVYQPVTLIGYNIINFDFPMIQNWINAYSRERFKFPAICEIVDVMTTIAAKKKSRWLKLAKAAETYDVKFEADELHDALADVRITWELYKKIRR